MAEEKPNVEVEVQSTDTPPVDTEAQLAVTADAAQNANLKRTEDGKTILIPQPSDDPEDPLNWSWSKKHGILIALGVSALLTDWGMTWGTVLFEMQARDWKMSVPDVAKSVSGGIFLQGPGGVLAVPLTQRFGRLPVLFWSQFLSCMMVVAASQAPTYAGFTACRTLQGFFDTAPQVIGLTIIHDMFFFHERTRKINIWAFTYLIGPYLGPFIAGFLIQKINWRQDFGVLAAFYGFSTLLIIFFGDETLYDRDCKERLPKGSGILYRIQLLTGYAGWKAKGRPTVGQISRHLIAISWLPYMLLPCMFYLLVVYMWAIGITTSVTQFVKPPPYRFSDTAVSLLFFAPMIGVLVAELWGHVVNDWLCNFFLRKNGGIHNPEIRLWAVYPAVIVGVASLVLYGQTLQHSLSWLGIAFGWGMNSFGMLAATTAVSAYILDVFPHHSALASAWSQFWRVTGGFVITYYNPKWVAESGPAVAFGCQAAILAASFASVVVVQIYGRRWRAKFPVPEPEN